MINESHYDAILPSHIRYASNISQNEKIFFLELTSLVNKYGYSWATNEWLSEHFHVNTRTISTWISNLKRKNYISIKYDSNSCRKIYLRHIQPRISNKSSRTEGDDTPGYYSVVPSHIRYSLGLSSNEKIFYSEIRALSNSDGCCWAKNKYFEKLYNVSERTIQRWIKNLADRKFIFVHHSEKNNRSLFLGTPDGSKQFIKLKLSTEGGRRKCRGGRRKCREVTPKKDPYLTDFNNLLQRDFESNIITTNNIIKKDNNRVGSFLNKNKNNNKNIKKYDKEKFIYSCKKNTKSSGNNDVRIGFNQIDKIINKLLE